MQQRSTWVLKKTNQVKDLSPLRGAVSPMVARVCHFSPEWQRASNGQLSLYDQLNAEAAFAKKTGRTFTIYIHANGLNLDLVNLRSPESQAVIEARDAALVENWRERFAEWKQHPDNKNKPLATMNIQVLSARRYRIDEPTKIRWKEGKKRHKAYVRAFEAQPVDLHVKFNKLGPAGHLRKDIESALLMPFIQAEIEKAQLAGVDIKSQLNDQSRLEAYNANIWAFIRSYPDDIRTRIARHVLTEAYDDISHFELEAPTIVSAAAAAATTTSSNATDSEQLTTILFLSKDDRLTETMKDVRSAARKMGYKRGSLKTINPQFEEKIGPVIDSPPSESPPNDLSEKNVIVDENETETAVTIEQEPSPMPSSADHSHANGHMNGCVVSVEVSAPTVIASSLNPNIDQLQRPTSPQPKTYVIETASNMMSSFRPLSEVAAYSLACEALSDYVARALRKREEMKQQAGGQATTSYRLDSAELNARLEVLEEVRSTVSANKSVPPVTPSTTAIMTQTFATTTPSSRSSTSSADSPSPRGVNSVGTSSSSSPVAALQQRQGLSPAISPPGLLASQSLLKQRRPAEAVVPQKLQQRSQEQMHQLAGGTKP